MNLFFPWKRAYAKHYYVSTSFEKKSLHFQKVLHKTSLHFEGFWEKKSLTFHIYLKIVPILSCKHPIQHSNFAHWSITHLNSMIKLQFKDSDINKCSKYSWWNRTKKLSITTKRVLHDYIFCSAFSNKKLQHSETFFGSYSIQYLHTSTKKIYNSSQPSMQYKCIQQKPKKRYWRLSLIKC